MHSGDIYVIYIRSLWKVKYCSLQQQLNQIQTQ